MRASKGPNAITHAHRRQDGVEPVQHHRLKGRKIIHICLIGKADRADYCIRKVSETVSGAPMSFHQIAGIAMPSAGFCFGCRGSSSAWDRPVRMDSRVFITRSEEHTSELQSLMRISYAVFCVKKKK